MPNYKDLIIPNNKKRANIRAAVKEAVFKRANGQCEYRGCHKDLKWGNRGCGPIGIFHHKRDPAISPTKKTVDFVCPDHHGDLHETKITKKPNPFTGIPTREIKIKRKPAKPKTRKPQKKRTQKKRSPFPDYSLI